MVLGMSLPTFTIVHVIISLVAIVAGIVVVVGMISSSRLATWTALFLSTTVLTSATGFLFPFGGLKPSHVFGVVSLILLALALAALYRFDLRGRWRTAYIVSSVVAFYLNAFVLVVQSFQKVSFLNVLAPTGTELPFAAAQLVVLVLCAWAGFLATRRFHPHAMSARPALST